jgi:putative membrane protein
MIEGYSDHAANERTFLAWVRTGVAVIAFGFVIEKFDLFLLHCWTTVSKAAGSAASRRITVPPRPRCLKPRW